MKEAVDEAVKEVAKTSRKGTRRASPRESGRGPITVYVNLDNYRRFKEICDREGTTISKEIDAMFKRRLGNEKT